jgi:16S rRNA (cytosine1402-N4)-methyltransferase
VDATAGAGGHLQRICSLKGTGEGVLALDRDLSALQKLTNRTSEFLGVHFVHTNFADIQTVLTQKEITTIDGGILADLGLSSNQLEENSRGFSFSRPGPLDMRMDTSNPSSPDAYQLVNYLKEKELADIIYKYGEETHSRLIANRIVNNRPIETTADLANIIASSQKGRGSIHPATRTFQALRIAVNNELDSLQQFLKQSAAVLAPGARLVVITFHSLEDRIVKQFFKQMASNCLCPPRQPVCTCNHKPQFQILTRKPIVPAREEVLANLRSRSAKLRAAEKLAQ